MTNALLTIGSTKKLLVEEKTGEGKWRFILLGKIALILLGAHP
jgi:hypothetical protein